MAKKKKRVVKKVPVDFEASFAEVESIVRKLEQGQLGLTESLEQYEKGVKYLKRCYQALEQAEQKIELLTGIDRKGNSTTVPFVDETEEDVDDSDEATSSSSGTLFDDYE